MGKYPAHIKGFPLYEHIWSKLHFYNQNFLGIFTGEPGSGKTYAALNMAWALDRKWDGSPNFDISKIVFSYEEFLFKCSILKKGEFLIWDEVGTALNPRDFYEKKNKLSSSIHQVFRMRNLGVLYTVPDISLIDKQIRILLNNEVVMQKVYPKKKVAVGRFYFISKKNHFDDKLKLVLPSYLDSNGVRSKAANICFTLPPKELIQDYEFKKKNYVNYIFEEAKNQFRLDSVKKKAKVDLVEVRNKVLESISEYMLPSGQVDVFKIATDFGVGVYSAKTISSYLKTGIKEKALI